MHDDMFDKLLPKVSIRNNLHLTLIQKLFLQNKKHSYIFGIFKFSKKF